MSAKLLVHLGEVDVRGAFRELGFSSIYDYCVSGLRMSEGEAGLRIYAARLGRRFPLVVERLSANELHLSGIKLLAPHLTDDNCLLLLDRARGKSKRQIQSVLAELAPQPDVPTRMRKVPTARGSHACATSVVEKPLALDLTQACSASVNTNVSVAPVPPCAAAPSRSPEQHTLLAISPQPARPRAALTTPLSPGRFKLELTLGQEAHDKLEQLRELLRHQNPTGDLAPIIERAIIELLDRT
ncbi:MAG TPA: hypothetical protein VMF89_33100, partial [Polyangiales bacterium]|nr:hypothetical protein [Polyangiales bacterium]